jgi:hypothetical protein
MNIQALPSFRSVGRGIALGLLASIQAFAAMPGGGDMPRFRGGFRGGYGGGFHGRFGWRGGPRYGWGRGYYLAGLPFGCLTLAFGGAAWYYGGGYWYRPYGAGYIVDCPPVGIGVPFLPPGYVTYYDAGVPYYWADDVYYTAVPSGTGYVVAAPPPGATPPPNQTYSQPPGPAPSQTSSQMAVLPPSQPSSQSPGQPSSQSPSQPSSQPSANEPEATVPDALVILPENGQTEAQILADRQAAQRYASSKAGYDPARSDPADPGTPRARQAYLRAMKSYLETRGYSVK